MNQQGVNASIPFVGRQTELGRLHQALRTVISNRKPKFVLVQGDFGVGKTVLVDHFLSEASAQNQGVLVGRGKCAMETELNGLIPFGQILASLAQYGVRHETRSSNLSEFLKEVAPAWIDIFSFGLGTALVKTAKEGKKLVSQNTFTQESVFIQFANALKRIAQDHTVIAFIDDLHWADASSLRLLFHLARCLEDRAILFVCAYRPVEALETGENVELFRDIRGNLIRYNADELQIEYGIDVAEYVRQRYPLNTFSTDVIENIQEHTEGHALFVSQLFTLWQEGGLLTSVPAPDGRPVWKLQGDVEEMPPIPLTLGVVLEERVQQMRETLCKMLDYAAVEGEDFTAQVVSRLRKLDEMETYDDLEVLEERYRLVRQQGSKQAGSKVLDLYRFTHRFFREHIYHQVSAPKRRNLHRQIGECLEELYSEHQEIAGQLALHFREAQDHLKAAKYGLMASQFEQTHHSWAEVESWCQFSLAQLDKLPPNAQHLLLKLDLLEQSANGFYSAGKHAAADQGYREALNLATQMQVETKRVANLYYLLADVCFAEDKADDTMRLLDLGKQTLAGHEMDSPALAEVYIKLQALWAFMQLRHKRRELAVKTLRELLDNIADPMQTPALWQAIAQAYHYLGVSLYHLSLFSAASDAFREAIRFSGQAAWEDLAGTSLVDLADICCKQGKLDEAEALLNKALESAVRRGNLGTEAFARATRCPLLLLRGNPQEALTEINKAIDISEQIGARWNTSRMLSDKALAELALSNLNSAYKLAKRSTEIAEETSRKFGIGYTVLGRIEAARENWAAAEQHFTQAITIHQTGRDLYLAAQAQRHFAEALLKQGKPERVIELLHAALDTFKNLELENEVKALQRLIAESAARTE